MHRFPVMFAGKLVKKDHFLNMSQVSQQKIAWNTNCTSTLLLWGYKKDY